MSIYIDARLEQNEPEIYLRNDHGKILMHWTSRTVRRWLENGDVNSDELRSAHYSWLDLMADTR